MRKLQANVAWGLWFIGFIACLFCQSAFAEVQVGGQTIPDAGSTGGADPRGQISVPQIFDAAPETEKPQEALPNQPLPAQEEKSASAQNIITVHHVKLVGVVEHPTQRITVKRLQALADKLLQKALKGGDKISVDGLWHIADALTLEYRQAGFILSRVYVPAQKITESSTILLQVQEGILGKVLVEGSDLYAPAAITRQFNQQLGKPVVADTMEGSLLRIHSYPGLAITSVFRPGARLGETDLVIQPKRQRRLNAVLSYDNSGASLTGRNRALAQVTVNNPFEIGDRLNVTAIQNYAPRNGFYGTFNYEAPLAFSDNSIGFDLSKNQFMLGGVLTAARVSGTSVISGAHLRRRLLYDRFHELFADIRMEHIDAKTHLGQVLMNNDRLTVASIGTSYSARDAVNRSHTQANLRFHQGFNNLLGAMGVYDSHSVGTPPTRAGGSGKRVQGRFEKVRGGYSYLRYILDEQFVQFKLEGQYTRDLLAPLQEFNLGGMNNVRAYATSEILVDKALFSSLEWSIHAPGFSHKAAYGGYTWGQLLDVSAFVDAALGRANDPTLLDRQSGHDRVTLKGYGVGLKFRPSAKAMMHLQAAKPMGGARLPTDRKDIRYWFSLVYYA